MDPAGSTTVEVARETQRLVDVPDDPVAPSPVEAHVEHVPAEGLSARDETATVEVEVVADVPEDDATSAADIVRRIVAEVTAAAPPTPPPGDAAAPDAPDGTPEDGEREEEPPPAPPTSRREPTRELDPSAVDPDAAAPAHPSDPTSEDRADTARPAESEPTQQVPFRRPDPEPESEPTQQVPVRRPDPEPESTREVPQAATGVSLLETGGATDAVDEPTPGASLPAADEPGFEAVVYAPPSPHDEEAPDPPGPDPSAEDREAKPHTLRWLLTSILGAIALAVLLPLAVGALRSLVALG
jgi:hypothetical protein